MKSPGGPKAKSKAKAPDSPASPSDSLLAEQEKDLEERYKAWSEQRKQWPPNYESWDDVDPQPEFQPLTTEELLEMRKLVLGDEKWWDQELPPETMNNVRPDVLYYGVLSEYPETELLVWLNKLYDDPFWKESDDLAFWIASRAKNNDWRFFERFSRLLRGREQMKKANLSMAHLSPKKIGFKVKGGRPWKPWDLARAVPIAVENLLSYRVWEEPPDGKGKRLYRITRQELQCEIRFVERNLGRPAAAGTVKIYGLRENELSTWIVKTDVRKFMARKSNSETPP